MKRIWQQRPICEVVPGDTIAGFGQVKLVQENIEIPDEGDVEAGTVWIISITNVLGATRDFAGHDVVQVFSGL